MIWRKGLLLAQSFHTLAIRRQDQQLGGKKINCSYLSEHVFLEFLLHEMYLESRALSTSDCTAIHAVKTREGQEIFNRTEICETTAILRYKYLLFPSFSLLPSHTHRWNSQKGLNHGSLCIYTVQILCKQRSLKPCIVLVLNKSKLSLLLFNCTLFITLHSKPYTKLIQ